MTREEFTALPLKLALAVIWDLARAKLEQMPAPAIPRAPKFDGKLPRKDGFSWVSEFVLDDLKWWLEAKRKSATAGGEWAEKDAKLAANLEKWIAWRELFPSDRWRGKRGEEFVTADPPSKPPALREWGPRPAGPSNSGKSNGARPPTDRGAPPPAANEEDSYDY